MFLFKESYLTYIVDSLLLNSWSPALELMPAQNLSNTHFLHKVPYSLLVLRKTRQYVSTTHGGHFKQRNH